MRKLTVDAKTKRLKFSLFKMGLTSGGLDFTNTADERGKIYAKLMFGYPIDACATSTATGFVPVFFTCSRTEAAKSCMILQSTL
jgi:hypothetical protein